MSNIIKAVIGKLTLGDVEDPEVYAAGPLMEWQESEKGQWCMENCIAAPYYTIMQDYGSWGYTIKIVGDLTEKDYTYFTLRWGQE